MHATQIGLMVNRAGMEAANVEGAIPNNGTPSATHTHTINNNSLTRSNSIRGPFFLQLPPPRSLPREATTAGQNGFPVRPLSRFIINGITVEQNDDLKAVISDPDPPSLSNSEIAQRMEQKIGKAEGIFTAGM